MADVIDRRRLTTAVVAVGLSALLVSGCAPALSDAGDRAEGTTVQDYDLRAATGSSAPDAPPSDAPASSDASPASDTPSPSSTRGQSSSSSSGEQKAASGSAVAAVEALQVKGRAPKTGYDRNQFGSAWVDVNRNGCDTRNDMLKATLTDKEMSGSCKVLSGTLADPYTDESIDFLRGGASEVDIDHVVALGDSWQKGAQQWPYAKRIAFANDPLNLQPTDAGANRQKGDSDAASWLPSNKEYRCDYVAQQAAVKKKYGLWVTAAEQEAMLRVLAKCPGHELPGPGAQPTTASNTGGRAPTAVKPESSSTPRATPPRPTSGGQDPQFRTCGDANDAGFGPYYQGRDAEYEWYQDRDKDGAVCES